MRTQPRWRTRLLSNSTPARAETLQLGIFYGEINAPHKDVYAYWRVRLICATLVLVGPPAGHSWNRPCR
jgi:hypothetical protein